MESLPGMDGEQIPREQAIDGRLAVLALLEARLDEDDERMMYVWRNADQISLVPSVLGLLTDTLLDLGIDVREWVTRTRAELVDTLADPDDPTDGHA